MIVILIIGFGGYYLLMKTGKITNSSNTALNTTQNTNSVEILNENSTVTIHNELDYTNQEFGFSLAFPLDWRGYTTEIWRSYYQSPDNPTSHTFLVFRHPQTTSSTGLVGEVSFFIIITENTSTDLFPLSDLITTSASGVRFSYRVGTGAAPGELQHFADEVPSIISTLATNLATKKDANDEIDTSNWTTYQDNEVGYSLAYPGTWTVEEIRLNSDPLGAFATPIRYNIFYSPEKQYYLILGIKRLGPSTTEPALVLATL
jgi:hypothetical protein